MEVFRRHNVSVYNVTPMCNIGSTRVIFSRLNGRLKIISPNHVKGLDQIHIHARYSVNKLLNFFNELVNPHDDTSLTFVRVRCDPGMTANVSPVLFNNDDTPFNTNTYRAIICISHDNVTGGIHNFKYKNDLMVRDLLPGDLILYKPSEILHTCKSPYSLYPNLYDYGIVDFMLLQADQKMTV